MDIKNKSNESIASGNNWLKECSNNIFSQFGEDGIIEKIFSMLPDSNRWCVEFGAWDGKHLSNTHLLLSQKGWSGVLFEASRERFGDLLRTYDGNEKIICINKMVAFEGKNTLDRLLAITPVPEDFDLLSIDVDGNDYHIWRSLEKYRPRVVIIEFNNTIPNSVEFIQPADPSVNQGSSLLAMCNLGKEKGYELIAVTDSNAFFADAKYFEFFQIGENSPEAMNGDQKYLTHIFQLYDGTLVAEGNLKLLWHGIPIDQKKIQVLPSSFRYFPEKKVNPLIKFAFSIYRKLFLK